MTEEELKNTILYGLETTNSITNTQHNSFLYRGLLNKNNTPQAQVRRQNGLV